MKSMALTLLALLNPVFAGAVTVKNCPQTLNITYKTVRALSDDELERAVKDHVVDLNTVVPYRNALKEAGSESYQKVRLNLASTKGSVCSYLREGEKLKGGNETRLFTRGGRDILRVSLAVGGYELWTYHNVTEYSINGLTVERSSSKVLGYFDHGAPRIHIGWANQLNFDGRTGNHVDAILRVPLFIEGDDQPIPMKEINAKLVAKGLKALPEYIDVTSEDEDVYLRFDRLDVQIQKALDRIGMGHYMRDSELMPGDHNTSELKTCYFGDGKAVADVAMKLTDINYSEQMILLGWKYKNYKFVDSEGFEDPNEAEWLITQGSETWRLWESNSEDVLMVVALSDDGNDINEALIPRCQ